MSAGDLEAIITAANNRQLKLVQQQVSLLFVEKMKRSSHWFQESFELNGIHRSPNPSGSFQQPVSSTNFGRVC
jgi:hypothetical protein